MRVESVLEDSSLTSLLINSLDQSAPQLKTLLLIQERQESELELYHFIGGLLYEHTHKGMQVNMVNILNAAIVNIMEKKGYKILKLKITDFEVKLEIEVNKKEQKTAKRFLKKFLEGTIVKYTVLVPEEQIKDALPA